METTHVSEKFDLVVSNLNHSNALRSAPSPEKY